MIGMYGFLVTTAIITPAVILHDVGSHPRPRGCVPADRGAMAASGMPYVSGKPV